MRRIVISKNITNSTISVVPLTETKKGDEYNLSSVDSRKDEYYFVNKDTTILIDNIITIKK